MKVSSEIALNTAAYIRINVLELLQIGSRTLAPKIFPSCKERCDYNTFR